MTGRLFSGAVGRQPVSAVGARAALGVGVGDAVGVGRRIAVAVGTGSGGRGVGSEENFEVIYSLADGLRNRKRVTITIDDIRCPQCGSETVVKTIKKGPNSHRFHVCTRYPECKGKVPLSD